MATTSTRLALTISAHAVLRIAGSASGVLIGIYLASLSGHGFAVDAGLLGGLGAVSFAAELVASLPLGVAADALSPRWLMVSGCVLGACAVQLFALSTSTGVFLASRTLEGVAAAAVTPPLLAFLAETTAHDSTLRARAMSYFELSLLAGLALGGLAGSESWHFFHRHAFSVIAVGYLVCILPILAGARQKKGARGSHAAWRGMLRALADPSVRTLAPVWLCVNAVVGLWLGPTLPFLLTQKHSGPQYLHGIFAANPTQVGWLMLGYAMIFGTGVFCWSFVLPRIRISRAMRVSLYAMLPVCLGLYVVNHSAGFTAQSRWIVLGLTALLVMIESGFTPAALSWLAGSLGAGAGRGSAMGIYSVLLSLGAIGGSLLAGALGKLFYVDGLLLGTVLLAVLALFLLRGVMSLADSRFEEAYERP